MATNTRDGHGDVIRYTCCDRPLDLQRYRPMSMHMHVSRDRAKIGCSPTSHPSGQAAFHRLVAARVAVLISSRIPGTNVWARNSPDSSVM